MVPIQNSNFGDRRDLLSTFRLQIVPWIPPISPVWNRRKGPKWAQGCQITKSAPANQLFRKDFLSLSIMSQCKFCFHLQKTDLKWFLETFSNTKALKQIMCRSSPFWIIPAKMPQLRPKTSIYSENETGGFERVAHFCWQWDEMTAITEPGNSIGRWQCWRNYRRGILTSECGDIHYICSLHLTKNLTAI